MTEKVWKWFWVWDFEKEEKWLQKMADEGWALCRAGFCNYTFEKCEPGEYNIRLEMRSNDSSYQEFLEEIGAEDVGQVFKWSYYRRKSELGEFDLFSDIDSRLEHLHRISWMLKMVGFANIMIGIGNSLGNRFGWINLLCGCLLMYGLGRINAKEEVLAEERKLRE
ncbi:MAG: DUF2812 domain-containing protein [Erysipelotrichaceae bacterium]|nr:DUF2812 domain-containing protein [Erysipelotrichaceae bacterium]